MNYGEFGGQYVPQELKGELQKIEENFKQAITDKEFIKEYKKFQSGEYGNMSVVLFAKLQSIAVSTFYKYVNILNKKKEVK